MGCLRAPRTSGELVTHQATYVSTRHGVQVPFDIHWKLADPKAFADMFSFEELARDSVPIPGLGASARTFCDVHALLTSCVHRVAHHYDREILLFLYDIDLLARRLGAEEWNRVASIAAQKQICAVTARGLDLAVRLFGTPVPSAVAAALAAGGADEPTAAYLRGGLRKVDLLWSDLLALKGRRRLELVWEHLFPPRRFLLESYGPHTRLPVPVLYVHRIFRGAYSWFRPLR
jgi:putative nucleotidyltransferase-like protein